MRGGQRIRVAFLTRYDRSRASSRVRVYDYLPHLLPKFAIKFKHNDCSTFSLMLAALLLAATILPIMRKNLLHAWKLSHLLWT